MYFNFKIIRLLLCASLYANWNSNCSCCFNWQISWLQTQVRPKSDPKIHQLTQKNKQQIFQSQIRPKSDLKFLSWVWYWIWPESISSQTQVRTKSDLKFQSWVWYWVWPESISNQTQVTVKFVWLDSENILSLKI